MRAAVLRLGKDGGETHRGEKRNGTTFRAGLVETVLAGRKGNGTKAQYRKERNTFHQSDRIRGYSQL